MNNKPLKKLLDERYYMEVEILKVIWEDLVRVYEQYIKN